MALLAASAFAQQAAKPVTDAPVKVTVIKGLPNIKDNTQGSLIIGDGSLHFAHEAQMSDLSAHSIEDVVTGDDSQRVIRGTVGTLSWFVPYGAWQILEFVPNEARYGHHKISRRRWRLARRDFHDACGPGRSDQEGIAGAGSANDGDRSRNEVRATTPARTPEGKDKQ